MLKIKLQQNEVTYQDIVYTDFGMASDLSYISGVCDSSYHLSDSSRVVVSTPYNIKGFETNVETEDFTIQGTLSVTTKYPLIKSSESISTAIKYCDGQYYYNRLNDPYNIYIGENKYSFSPIDSDINIKSTYNITSDTLETYDGTVYHIEFQRFMSNGNIVTDAKVYDENGELKIFLLPNIFKTPKTYTKFIIRLDDSVALDVDYVSPCEVLDYVVYDNAKYYVTDGHVKVDDTIFGEQYDNDSIKMNDGSILPIEHEYVDGAKGKMMNLYLSDTQIDIKLGDIISAENLNGSKKRITLTNGTDDEGYSIGESAFINGHFYKKQDTVENGSHFDFAVIGGEEYRILYKDRFSRQGSVDYQESVDLTVEWMTLEDIEDMTEHLCEFENGYLLIYNDELEIISTIDCDIENNRALLAYRDNDVIYKHFSGSTNDDVMMNNVLYGVHRYSFVEYQGVKYKVFSNNRSVASDTIASTYVLTDLDYIELNFEEKYYFKVVGIESPNIIRLEPQIMNEYEMSGSSYLYEATVDAVAVTDDVFVYKLNKQILGTESLNGLNFSYSQEGSFALNVDTVKLHKVIDYITCSIGSSQRQGIGLNKESMVNGFIREESDNSINPIVDMDKDVYIPTYNDDLIHEIQFKLHFRTRNMSDWTINSSLKQNLSSDTNSTICIDNACGWFSTDYYNSIDVSDACRHSDLLGFLNFTNNDIYYKKSKLDKSFIRLEYYDSTDYLTQNLLYQSTIWFNTTETWKKYSDGQLYANNADTYFDVLDEVVKKVPSVITEKFKNLSNYDFDYQHRLDATLTCSERNQGKDSSEGFYLYLFKNLLQGLYDETIYLKVTFNHAGEGQRCLMTVPKMNGERITDFTEEEINSMYSGVPIENLNEYIYIPIKIVFNEKLNKFTYMVKDNMCDFVDGKMIFNLFEMKTADEYAVRKITQTSPSNVNHKVETSYYLKVTRTDSEYVFPQGDIANEFMPDTFKLEDLDEADHEVGDDTFYTKAYLKTVHGNSQMVSCDELKNTFNVYAYKKNTIDDSIVTYEPCEITVSMVTQLTDNDVIASTTLGTVSSNQTIEPFIVTHAAKQQGNTARTNDVISFVIKDTPNYKIDYVVDRSGNYEDYSLSTNSVAWEFPHDEYTQSNNNTLNVYLAETKSEFFDKEFTVYMRMRDRYSSNWTSSNFGLTAVLNHLPTYHDGVQNRTYITQSLYNNPMGYDNNHYDAKTVIKFKELFVLNNQNITNPFVIDVYYLKNGSVYGNAVTSFTINCTCPNWILDTEVSYSNEPDFDNGRPSTDYLMFGDTKDSYSEVAPNTTDTLFDNRWNTLLNAYDCPIGFDTTKTENIFIGFTTNSSYYVVTVSNDHESSDYVYEGGKFVPKLICQGQSYIEQEDVFVSAIKTTPRTLQYPKEITLSFGNRITASS